MERSVAEHSIKQQRESTIPLDKKLLTLASRMQSKSITRHIVTPRGAEMYMAAPRDKIKMIGTLKSNLNPKGLKHITETPKHLWDINDSMLNMKNVKITPAWKFSELVSGKIRSQTNPLVLPSDSHKFKVRVNGLYFRKTPLTAGEELSIVNNVDWGFFNRFNAASLAMNDNGHFVGMKKCWKTLEKLSGQTKNLGVAPRPESRQAAIQQNLADLQNEANGLRKEASIQSAKEERIHTPLYYPFHDDLPVDADNPNAIVDDRVAGCDLWDTYGKRYDAEAFSFFIMRAIKAIDMRDWQKFLDDVITPMERQMRNTIDKEEIIKLQKQIKERILLEEKKIIPMDEKRWNRLMRLLKEDMEGEVEYHLERNLVLKKCIPLCRIWYRIDRESFVYYFNGLPELIAQTTPTTDAQIKILAEGLFKHWALMFSTVMEPGQCAVTYGTHGCLDFNDAKTKRVLKKLLSPEFEMIFNDQFSRYGSPTRLQRNVFLIESFKTVFETILEESGINFFENSWKDERLQLPLQESSKRNMRLFVNWVKNYRERGYESSGDMLNDTEFNTFAIDTLEIGFVTSSGGSQERERGDLQEGDHGYKRRGLTYEEFLTKAGKEYNTPRLFEFDNGTRMIMDRRTILKKFSSLYYKNKDVEKTYAKLQGRITKRVRHHNHCNFLLHRSPTTSHKNGALFLFAMKYIPLAAHALPKIVEQTVKRRFDTQARELEKFGDRGIDVLDDCYDYDEYNLEEVTELDRAERKTEREVRAVERKNRNDNGSVDTEQREADAKEEKADAKEEKADEKEAQVYAAWARKESTRSAKLEALMTKEKERYLGKGYGEISQEPDTSLIITKMVKTGLKIKERSARIKKLIAKIRKNLSVMETGAPTPELCEKFLNAFSQD